MGSKVTRFFISLGYIVAYLVFTIIMAMKIQDFSSGTYLLQIFLFPVGYLLYTIAFDSMQESPKVKTRIVLTVIGSVFLIVLPFILTLYDIVECSKDILSMGIFWIGVFASPFLFGCLLLLSYFLNAGFWEREEAAVIVPPTALVASIVICLLCAIAHAVFVSFWIPFILGFLSIGVTIFLAAKFGSPFH